MANKTLTELYAEFEQMWTLRYQWELEWKQVMYWLLPGRGHFNKHTRRLKRSLTSPKLINTYAKEAQEVLIAGVKAGAISPVKRWFDLKWNDAQISDIKFLEDWLEDAKEILYDEFARSNFYREVDGFLSEYSGFGNAVSFFGANSDPFYFHTITVGEYVMGMNNLGVVDKIYRVLFMSPRAIIEEFGEANVSDHIKTQNIGAPEEPIGIAHYVYPEEFRDKPYSSVYAELGASDDQVLRRSGYYEFPFMVCRWDVISGDTYGLGPGTRAVPHIRRLQEEEKALLMAGHKSLNPPLNIPAKLKNKTRTLPGGENLYSNPNERIYPVYEVRFDMQAGMGLIDRSELRISKIFFNDIFLTASRDPNASPLRTGEVNVREDEKLLRIGPVVESLYFEALQPVVERAFSICLRKGKFPELPPEYAEMLGGYKIVFISPLAQAQKLMAAGPINNFLQFTTAAVQYDPTVLDKVNMDSLVEEYADITGVSSKILRSDEEVAQIREQRAQAQAEEKAKQDAMMNQQAQLQGQQQQADIAKTYGEAGAGMQQLLGGNA